MGFNYGSSPTGHCANWGSKNGYDQMGYGMMTKPQNAYAMAAGTWDESHAQSYGNYKSQTGPVMSKTQLHGPPGNGYGASQMHSYGYGHNTSPGKHEGRAYGYGGPTPAARYQKNGGGMGHGFGQGKYEVTEAYGAYGEYANNGMAAHSRPHLHGKHSGGYGNGFVTAQGYGPAKHMGFEYAEAEACEYREETHFSKEQQRQYYGGAGGYHGRNNPKAKGLIQNNSGHYSSDSESDHDDDWVSKAI